MRNKYSLKKLFNNLVIKISLITIIVTILAGISWILWINVYPRDYYTNKYESKFTQLVIKEIDNIGFQNKLTTEIKDQRFDYIVMKNNNIFVKKGQFGDEELERLLDLSSNSYSYVKKNTMYSYKKIDKNADIKILATYPAFSTGNRMIDKVNAAYQVLLIVCPFLVFLFTLHYQTKKLHKKIAGDFEIVESNLKKIELGDLEHPLPSFDNIEFNDLSSKINDMRTSLKESVGKLENQYSIQRHLFSSIAHDVRTPLTIISAETEMLEIENPEKKITDRTSTIFSEVKQINVLLTELLKIISLNSNQYSLNHECFDLVEMIRMTINEFESLAIKNSTTIELITNVEECRIVSDISMLNRVIGNLLTNAIDHTGDNINITISIDDLPNKVILQIENSGSQFPDNILLKDFIPLTGESKKYHFGLGMYMSNEIIKNLGGEMKLKNSKNKAIVRLELPKGMNK